MFSRHPDTTVRTANLLPPCKGWKADLPAPGAMTLNTPENAEYPLYRSDIYVEIPRHSFAFRGFGVLLILLMLPICFLEAQTIYRHLISPSISALILDTLSIVVMSFTAMMGYRLDFSAPRNEPIRFNRARQKIYAYNFKPCGWNPWCPWPIEIMIYEWSQVRAELWSRGSGTNHRCGTMLSIVKPGTNEVIDRFPLNYDTLSEDPWLYIHTYMEKGPDALPPFDTPRDPNELVWYSPFRRWAPKVKWPEDIDRESTTAP